MINKLYYPLSGHEMMKLNPDAIIITYSQLNDIYDINDLFKNTDKIIILYLLQSIDSGHWVCLYKDRKNKTLNFFDSYGKSLDHWVNMLSPMKAQEYGQEKGKLDELLHDYLVLYNNITLQYKDTATCGCFVSHRLHNSNMNEKEYIDKYFKNKNKSPDEIVSDYCFKLLGYEI
jgi:hypothetical protein